MKPLIKLEKVSKIYSLGKMELKVVKDVSLEVFKRDFMIILGPSGSGKSTLLHLISCLDTPTKGKIYLEQKDVSTLSENELAEIRGKKIGFVFQQFNLLGHLTALQNVIIPTLFRANIRKDKEEKAKEILSSLGLKERVDHRPSELSGGEKQRVAIARALINDPEIIVADEPTGNVGSKVGIHIMEILKDLNEREGRTIIVVTHDRELQGFGKRTIEIKDGEIDEK